MLYFLVSYFVVFFSVVIWNFVLLLSFDGNGGRFAWRLEDVAIFDDDDDDYNKFVGFGVFVLYLLSMCVVAFFFVVVVIVFLLCLRFH